MSKRKTLAIVAAVAAFAAVSASAASLGGLTGTSLGADSTVVASCDTVGGVAVTYTTAYSATPKEYMVSAVTLSSVDAACASKIATVTLANTAGTSIGTGTATVSGTSVTLTLGAPVSAALVTNVAVVIAG